MKLIDLATNKVETIAGHTVSDQIDGCQGKFYKPTDVCTEVNSIFVTDPAVGRVALIIHSSVLERFLGNV